jgi:hypothetical protein
MGAHIHLEENNERCWRQQETNDLVTTPRRKKGPANVSRGEGTSRSTVSRHIA